MPEHELIADSILKRFGEYAILSDISIVCSTGKVTGILGRNGSGKSTLLQIIFGTMRAESKRLRFDGVVHQQPYAEKDLIAYLPQHSFLPRNVSIRKIIGMFGADRQSIEFLMSDTFLSTLLDQTPNGLSAGQLRYAEVLLLVYSKAKFVLLDEPFMSIEPIYQEKISQLIQEYKSSKGFIITDHTYHHIIDVSDDLFLIYKGKARPITAVQELEDFGYLPPGTFSQGAQQVNEQKYLYGSAECAFEADAQTINDLQLFADNAGIWQLLFGGTITAGARETLTALLKNPVNDLDILCSRRDCFKFFSENSIPLQYSRQDMEIIGYYLSSQAPLLKGTMPDLFNPYRRNRSKKRNDRHIIRSGITRILEVLKQLNATCESIGFSGVPAYLSQAVFFIRVFTNQPAVRRFLFSSSAVKRSDLERLDQFFRKDCRRDLERVIAILYEMEAFQVVGAAVKKHNLCFPVYVNADSPAISLTGLFHPLVKAAVTNNFETVALKNVNLVTGANMSGKSTFLKSFGLATYLSHAGFPVPAERMTTTVFNGLVSTINLPDNLEKGYSHYYSEVRRIKYTAELLINRNKIVVIFDELFRGTNVREAHDATLMVTSAFAAIPSSIFLISTHILEIGAGLAGHKNIFFAHFPSRLEGEEPVYSYRITEGISEDRMGLHILRKEGIMDTLEQAARINRFS